IISDLLMPRMDGFEFVRRLRNDPAFTRTPIIFYTASYLKSEAQRLAGICGVSRILNKPAGPEEILEVVSSLLGPEQKVAAKPPVEEFFWKHLQLLTAKLSQRIEHDSPRFTTMV